MVEKAYKPVGGVKKELYTPEQRKKEYSLTWLEWISKTHQQIGRTGAISLAATGGSSITLWEVPKGKVLYVTSVWLGINNIVAGAGTAAGAINSGNPLFSLLSDNVNLGAPADSHAANSFTMPFKIPYPGNLKIVLEMISTGAATTVTVHGGFLGFLVPFSA